MFKKQVQTLYSDESKDRAMLKQEILSLKELNQQISQDAINLTNALKGDRKKFLDAGMDEYLTKPINKEKLAEIFKTFLEPKETV